MSEYLDLDPEWVNCAVCGQRIGRSEVGGVLDEGTDDEREVCVDCAQEMDKEVLDAGW